MFRIGADQIFRKCVFGAKASDILKHSHEGTVGGHYGATYTAKRMFDAGFYWPTIFKCHTPTRG